jgi:hypothetical protein
MSTSLPVPQETFNFKGKNLSKLVISKKEPAGSEPEFVNVKEPRN